MKNYLIYYLFITLSIIVNSCSEGFKEEYSKLFIALTEVTAITTPTTDTTPDYTFSSTESGAITYGGSCSSSTTSAISGNNTITLNTLSVRTYADCTITVSKTISTEKSEKKLSGSLTITPFTVSSTVSSSDDSSSSGSGVFVVVGDSGTIVRSTDNGETWDNETSPTANSLYGATFGNNTFVAVGLSGNIVRSTDMEKIGIMRLLEHHCICMESPTGTIPSWQWVSWEIYAPHQMEPLGLIGLNHKMKNSGESYLETIPSWQ